MRGMSAVNGTALEGLAHVVQSVRDILLTPIGTRVMRRDYGSRVDGLLDRPMGKNAIVEFTQAIAEALDRWEPRFDLDRVSVSEMTPDGRISLLVIGYHIEGARREPITITMTGSRA